MSDTKNALAELAERLTPKEVLNIEGRAVAHYIDFDALEKVQRIVAELAKYDRTGVGQFEIGKCRAIAEERS